ncbi:MAG: phosphate-starvation-inducible PsiE family protein [Methanomassiliicoccus sp.]|nr:phosphate-starvation-inducible PsiE family protein [Methanomassiliicoccus sp.]
MVNAERTVRTLVIYAIITLILILIVLVTIGLFLILVNDLLAGHFTMNKGEILAFFGQLLLVIIGVELLDTIRGLITESRPRADLVLLVAVTAASREIIIFNYEEAEGLMLLGLGVIIASATIGYYLVRKTQTMKDVPADVVAGKE